ncbi:Potassium transporter 7 [Platanthera guangdongensis]|uniref:Potassium transporter 7 n=1 Tax=Platanthera guangdongensis TaxID=2320717 RepID=A0ABR2MC02_9ASPA
MSEGSERDNGGLVKMDSTESRWVFQDDGDTQSEVQSSYESEEEGNGEQRLIKTDPKMDSFDVEAA